MKILSKLAFILITLFFVACSSEKSSQSGEASNKELKGDKEVAISENVSGYATIEELTQEILSSLQNKDYEDYLSHVMTKQMEKEVADQISERSRRKDFEKEFGFTIKHEKEEFDNLLKFIDERGLNLEDATLGEVEVVDYEHDHYSPLILKEVIIPIPHKNFEMDIIYTAIQINDRWFLTSELLI